MTTVSVERLAARRGLDVSLRGAVAYWHRNATVYRRTWLFGMIAWFLEPVIYLLAMGLGLGAYMESIRGVDYLEFIAPGLLATAAMYGATFEATWNTFTKIERFGVYEAARATPLTPEDVALGEVLWSATRATIHGTAFAVVATAFGVFRSPWALLAIPALIPIGVVFAIIGLTYTYVSSRIDYIAYYWTMFITPVFLFSGIFFPLDRLPDWVRVMAFCSPLYHGTNMMRALTSGAPLDALAPLLWLLAAALATVWLPLTLIKRRLLR
jgi:lipooligosaccharide transport system permease protein